MTAFTSENNPSLFRLANRRKCEKSLHMPSHGGGKPNVPNGTMVIVPVCVGNGELLPNVSSTWNEDTLNSPIAIGLTLVLLKSCRPNVAESWLVTAIPLAKAAPTPQARWAEFAELAAITDPSAKMYARVLERCMRPSWRGVRRWEKHRLDGIRTSARLETRADPPSCLTPIVVQYYVPSPEPRPAFRDRI